MMTQNTKILRLCETQNLIVGIITGNRAVIEPHLDEIEAMLTERYKKPVLLLLVPIQ